MRRGRHFEPPLVQFQRIMALFTKPHSPEMLGCHDIAQAIHLSRTTVQRRLSELMYFEVLEQVPDTLTADGGYLFRLASRAHAPAQFTHGELMGEMLNCLGGESEGVVDGYHVKIEPVYHLSAPFGRLTACLSSVPEVLVLPPTALSRVSCPDCLASDMMLVARWARGEDKVERVETPPRKSVRLQLKT
jgi:hypothetical protein